MNGALRSMREGNKASKAEVSFWEKPGQSSTEMVEEEEGRGTFLHNNV